MSRRGLLALALVLGPAALVHACRGEAPRAPAERAWSVQLHLHGSFSEGEGSIDSHSFEASEVGCEVLWWSDHDFRITTHEHVSRFGFEDWQEPLARNEPWTTRLRKYRGDQKGLRALGRPGPDASAAFVSDEVREGERSLLLSAAHQGPEFAALRFAFGAERRLERRSLATGLTLRLALFPLELPRDTRVVLEVRLSEHAPRAGLALAPRLLRYELSAAGGTEARDGLRHVLPRVLEVGRWNELAFELTRDAVRGFPESPGEDNALCELVLALETRNGARARVRFDDLRFEQERSGPPVYARQAELLREVGALHAATTQLQGLEVSYDSRHLNLFCEQTPLPDYAALARDCPRDAEDPELLDQRAFRERVLAWVLAETHARGGLVSYNHPFGATFEEGERARSNPEQLAVLLRNRADGADLLEVGYRERGGATLDDHLWLWDQAALAGLRLVGTGVSDSHGGPDNRWRGTPNNLVSWVYAAAPEKGALIAGLRAGRVFFGDRERFDGTLDLVLDSGERMGATVSARTTAVVELVARGTRAGQRLVLVESGQRTRTWPVTGTHVTQRVELAWDGARAAFVRFELHDEGGPIALSNPIHLVP